MIEKLIAFQTKITPASDKLGHFFWGFWYAHFGQVIDSYFNICFFVVFIPFIPATYKEVRDYFSEDGTPEFLDWVFTMVSSMILLIFF